VTSAIRATTKFVSCGNFVLRRARFAWQAT